VSLVRFDEQTISLQEGIEKSLNLINFRFSQKIQKVAIKPNLCYYWDYSTGETTDPKFVSALIGVIRHCASPEVEISVVESDASAMKCKYSFRMLGYEKMAREKSVKLVNLSNDQAEKVKVTVRNKTHQFSVPKTIAEADILIDVPKIKYMLGCKLTCALKNIYGCNPYPKKYKYHKLLDETILSLNKIMKPDLCIIDGIIVKGIKTRRLGLIMASTDPVAIDAAASEIAEINPHSVKYLELASKEGIGNINFVSKGEPLENFKKLFPGKNMKHRARRILSAIYSHFFAGT
jgi:uncharacterized protein (DUF362 family)